MTGDRLRVGLVGIGDIARKAYLPVLAARSDVELLLCSRNRGTLDAAGDAHRIQRRFTAVSDLIAEGLDAAFVHVATAAHVETAGALLQAGVPTYLDKPIADNLADCVRLAELATAKRCSFMVGFNRRHAPIYRALAEPAPWLVHMQKNRVDDAAPPRRVVFDDFVHVVDTLRFLAPNAALDDVRAVLRDGLLQLVAVRLVGEGVTATGSMNRDGGQVQEVLETHSAGLRRVVHDMAELHEHSAGRQFVVRRGDWTPVHVQRGFQAICDRFLDAVRDGEVLDPADAVRTHEICEAIVAEIEGG